MKQFKMFVLSQVLFMTMMMGCAPDAKESSNEMTVVQGHAGNFLVIKGHGFSENKTQNKVTFGDVPAQVLRADSRSLLVQVPAQLQKTATVTVVVAVGDNSSNAMLFAYNPNLIAVK
ncbi:IPT/TIG domain-containing protein [Chitinophaga sp. 212800010-3]|jgi:hypothetical protein|uniref:IPT/TIG domain-containing protein n=1 Tax=unclassified Chitinophaga TaxID=2619133 RepID=UPI002DEC8B41|nr:IPT/TIG domain-containing protein [Chitinophaga sp. 212800010-3]